MNILIYFYNILRKTLQYTSKTSETLETYACNMIFSATSTCCWYDWRLVDADLDATERCAASVEKAADAVENAMAGGWLGGEE
jgi:hypothetical protein